MTDLQVMMNWYAPQEQTIECECVDCGTVFDVDIKIGHRQKRCAQCGRKEDVNRHRAQRDPIIDLTKSVIKSAIAEQDRDFIQNNGIQLWLRAVGIGVTPSMNKQIESMLR